MKNKIFVYAKKAIFDIIKDILSEYKLSSLSLDDINNENYKNNNTLLVLEKDLTTQIAESFFSNNNVVIFSAEKKQLVNSTNHNQKNIFYGQVKIKKFYDEVKTRFISNKTILKNTEILGEKINNLSLGLSIPLTQLEKEILIVLFEKKNITKDYLLEEILKIKKNIETKTIESHLTRIRRKLVEIKSNIQIKSKNDNFFLDY